MLDIKDYFELWLLFLNNLEAFWVEEQVENILNQQRLWETASLSGKEQVWDFE